MSILAGGCFVKFNMVSNRCCKTFCAFFVCSVIGRWRNRSDGFQGANCSPCYQVSYSPSRLAQTVRCSDQPSVTAVLTITPKSKECNSADASAEAWNQLCCYYKCQGANLITLLHVPSGIVSAQWGLQFSTHSVPSCC